MPIDSSEFPPLPFYGDARDLEEHSSYRSAAAPDFFDSLLEVNREECKREYELARADLADVEAAASAYARGDTEPLLNLRNRMASYLMREERVSRLLEEVRALEERLQERVLADELRKEKRTQFFIVECDEVSRREYAGLSLAALGLFVHLASVSQRGLVPISRNELAASLGIDTKTLRGRLAELEARGLLRTEGTALALHPGVIQWYGVSECRRLVEKLGWETMTAPPPQRGKANGKKSQPKAKKSPRTARK